MFLKNLTFSILVLAFVGIFSRYSNPEKEAMLPKFTSLSTAIAGDYGWVKTNDSWRGELTPAQAGYSETIRLTENGVYQLFRNGKKVTERKFTITKSLNQTGQPDSVYRLRFVNKGSHSGTTDLVLQPDNGSLFTSNTRLPESIQTRMGCARSVYKRRQTNTVALINK